MTWGPGAHASTFGGNPVCLAAALATVGLLESEYVSNAARIGVYLKSSLLQLTNAHPAIGDVRGVGLMLGIEIVKDRGSKAHDPNLRNAIVSECFNRGLLVLGAGASTIRLSPPLLIDEEQADCAVRILSEAISAATI
jgi:4-aminobutyrate aminotransferase